MLEWKKMPRSLRLETEERALDVWPVIETFRAEDQMFPQTQKGYRFTVFDRVRRSYLSNGICLTEDDACEKALREAGI